MPYSDYLLANANALPSFDTARTGYGFAQTAPVYGAMTGGNYGLPQRFGQTTGNWDQMDEAADMRRTAAVQALQRLRAPIANALVPERGEQQVLSGIPDAVSMARAARDAVAAQASPEISVNRAPGGTMVGTQLLGPSSTPQQIEQARMAQMQAKAAALQGRSRFDVFASDPRIKNMGVPQQQELYRLAYGQTPADEIKARQDADQFQQKHLQSLLGGHSPLEIVTNYDPKTQQASLPGKAIFNRDTQEWEQSPPQVVKIPQEIYQIAARYLQGQTGYDAVGEAQDRAAKEAELTALRERKAQEHGQAVAPQLPAAQRLGQWFGQIPTAVRSVPQIPQTLAARAAAMSQAANNWWIGSPEQPGVASQFLGGASGVTPESTAAGLQEYRQGGVPLFQYPNPFR